MTSKLPPEGATFGLVGYFETPAALYHACESLRDSGYKDFDAQTPFPVHGLERAMGIPPTKLPWFVLAGGLFGLSGGVALTYYVATDYALNISGKPAFSYQIFVPVYFELLVLCSGLVCFFTLWAISGLPKYYHPTMKHPSAHRMTDDLFFISVEATDPKYDPERTRALLEKLGAKEVEEVTS